MIRRLASLIVLLIAILSLQGVGLHLTPQKGPFFRFVIIIDSSSSMKRNKEATLRTVQSLLGTGFQGLAKDGDVYGVWTVTDELDPGTFPPQKFAASINQMQMARAVMYVNQVKYKGKVDLARAVDGMKKVAEISKETHFFLVTDGTDVVYGTPFDLDISTMLIRYKSKLAVDKNPFVVTLAARNRKFEAYSVEEGGGRAIFIPVLKPEEKPVVKKKEPKKTPPKKKPTQASAKPPSKEAKPRVNAEKVVEEKPIPAPPVAKPKVKQVAIASDVSQAPKATAEEKRSTEVPKAVSKPVAGADGAERRALTEKRPEKETEKTETKPPVALIKETAPKPIDIKPFPKKEPIKEEVEAKKTEIGQIEPKVKGEREEPVKTDVKGEEQVAKKKVEAVKPISPENTSVGTNEVNDVSETGPNQVEEDPIDTFEIADEETIVSHSEPIAVEAIITPVVQTERKNSFLFIAIGLLGAAGAIAWSILRPKGDQGGGSLISKSYEKE